MASGGRLLIIEKTETDSTNDDARKVAMAGAPHGAMVLAASQRAGRGRAGRSFLSPEGGLYMSVVLRPRAPPHHWSVLPLLAGAAAAAAMRGRGFPVEIKWPNDLLVGGRKLGGVLVGSRIGPDPFAIVGFGVNLAGVPKGLDDATCLAHHGHAPDRRVLATLVLDALLVRAERLDASGPASVLPEVRALCSTLGRRVEWEDRKGVAADVADDGALLIDADGERVRVVAGDVRLRTR
jgi:BirA family biotin operon repressor/biotin-[acetyl-CoA-carboxylase] ligase